jgi:tartrate dehydratase beta subunit/fumarate hydratase class I family protein
MPDSRNSGSNGPERSNRMSKASPIQLLRMGVVIPIAAGLIVRTHEELSTKHRR